MLLEAVLQLKVFLLRGGVIDPDYRGEYIIMLRNNNSTEVSIAYHQKIAQLIFENASTPFIEVKDILPSSNQGTGGFGLTENKTPIHPFLPPRAPLKNLINRRQNWPHSQRRQTGHTSTVNPFPTSKLHSRSTKLPSKISFDDLQFMSKLHPINSMDIADKPSVNNEPTRSKPHHHSDKVVSSEPHSVTISRENLAKSTGF